ncbi:MAG: hypothetical protein WCP60_08380 [bacterium]
MTPSYLWTQQLRPIYDKAVELYRGGNRDLETYFTVEEKTFLASIGVRPINLYDYAEDMVGYGEPDWNTVLLIIAARRDYFLYHQHGVTASSVTEAAELPPKTEELEGIPWLPRIIAKANCFLKGGLCHEIMYGCGGDRRFLKEHDLHPADFLRSIWASGGDKGKVLTFVRRSRK